MSLELSVLEKLQIAHRLVAEVLGRAPQLYDCRLDQALLVLELSLKRAHRSPQMRLRLLRIPMNSDTHSENNRTLIRDCRTVVGA